MMEGKKNEAQALQEARLRLGSFNNMDGDKVANALNKHRDLWDSYVFGNYGGIGGRYGPSGMLIELRDLPEGHLNADTLLILSDLERWPKLEKVLMAKSLHADEIGYTGADDSTEGCAPFRTAEEVSTAMGGGFWVKNKDDLFPTGYEIVEGRLRKPAKYEPSQVPILVRVWWD